MSQQTFAQFIQTSPASLSSIFNGRTKPTLNIVEAIKAKLPSVSTDWLMFGTGPMYIDNVSGDTTSVKKSPDTYEPSLDFGSPLHSTVPVQTTQTSSQTLQFDVKNQNNQTLKNVYKNERSITEIRIFYNDQTWETFVPKNHK